MNCKKSSLTHDFRSPVLLILLSVGSTLNKQLSLCQIVTALGTSQEKSDLSSVSNQAFVCKQL